MINGFIDRSKVFLQAFIHMELAFDPYVFQITWERWSMTRSIALRAFCIFAVVTALAAITGAASQVEIAEILFLIGGSLSAVMLFFALTAPTRNLVPVRIRRRR
ncbi:hypothetical protein [Microvirga tunisiensis]|uniref:Uncharacterized protein n=1 Tax=Microvirga tunisiensis TaxID=2108360 RepID=A0A5N7MU00_9HYPH|nr:hypothetical protein [Microvirga tunisiensis]MPR11967.1 hypothetical protein [Microvirga tunisiensis]MPR29939.1 hypothetical protein [Microvirga tunisiensis]